MPVGSKITSVKDLKGKRIAVLAGKPAQINIPSLGQ